MIINQNPQLAHHDFICIVQHTANDVSASVFYFLGSNKNVGFMKWMHI